MPKRYREYLRINLTANVAKAIREYVVDTTFGDHQRKCWDDPDCRHHESGNLAVARLVESQITVGKKRGRLDIPCPWLTQANPEEFIELLDHVVARIKAFADNETPRTARAMVDAAEKISDYAHRNAMEVIANAAVDK